MFVHSMLRAGALLAHLAIATPSPRLVKADLTILMNNDLSGASSPVIASAVILLGGKHSYEDAVAACEALNETLWSPTSAIASIQTSLDYLVYEGEADKDSQFFVGPARTGDKLQAISVTGQVSTARSDTRLPALCTQSAPLASETHTDTATNWHISVRSNNEELIGFRDRTSFRFYGIRYAAQPKRFTHAEPYKGSNQVAHATAYGNECVQSGSATGSEDCLFLNIWTPFLPDPDQTSKSRLKPVMFWIHGGSFTYGAGSDTTFDGGSLASRGDVVVVTINYRLSTLGWLALDDGVTKGNYGLGDQITALDWVISNIKDFGGDANRITVFGQSAGAASVRALMASPKSQGKFAAAIPQSAPGGKYGKHFVEYYTIQEQVNLSGYPILAQTQCIDAPSHIDCLRQLPAYSLVTLNSIAASIVQDGDYITSNTLQFNGSAAPYKLLMGTMRDDGGALINFPKTSDESVYFTANGWPLPDPKLFPIPNDENRTLALYNMTARFATDAAFRCVNQATAYSGLESGSWDKVFMYDFDRSYQQLNYPSFDVCQAPVAAFHQHGDPTASYFRCHSGELYEVFGNLAFKERQLRDEQDLPFEQMVLDFWSSFARTHDPNPDVGYLTARNYSSTSKVLEERGRWTPATKGQLTLQALAWPPQQSPLRDLAQCDGIGLPLTYFERRGA